MGPPRFHCATLMFVSILTSRLYITTQDKTVDRLEQA
jgi:hypothetical protein